MRHPVRLVALLVLPVVAALAPSESSTDDQENYAALVEKYRRDDPAYYERLKRDLRAFARLPAEKQDRLRQLDRALHETDSVTYRRLVDALDRFGTWLDRLPEDARRRVEEAPTRDERLRIIKELREQEFLRRLPKKVLDDLDKLDPEKRAAAVARLRKEERLLRKAWRPAVSCPVRAEELSFEQQQYLEKVLLPSLNQIEKGQLERAEGQWPGYVQKLLALVEQHQLIGPTHYDALPPEAKIALPRSTLANKPKQHTELRRAEGKFPDFGTTFMSLLRRDKGHLTKMPGPSRPEELSPIHRAFVVDVLMPLLDNTEKEELKKAEGSWPEYAQKLLSVAGKHGREIPLLEFPGMRELAEKVRSPVAELPELPDRTLREFFLTELSADERTELRLSLDDPESRDRLRQKYFERHPKVLNKLQNNDKRTFSIKKAQ
jgi:hypothetical protein